MNASESLKRFRKYRGLTQQQLADNLSISKQLYYAYEKGNVRPPVEVFQKIAADYDISADYLLGIVDDPNYARVEKTDSTSNSVDTVDTIKISAKDFNSLAVAANSLAIAAKAFADAFLDISAKQNTSTADSQ